MKVFARIAVLAGVLGFLAFGSAFAQTDVMGRYVEALNDIAGAIETVNDEASAREAAHTIAGVNVELDELAEIVDAMDPATRAGMFQTRGMEFIQAQQRMSMALQGMMAHPEYFQIINDEMKKMPDIGQ